MAAPGVEFFFDYASPYSYLGSLKIEEAVNRHGGQLSWKPMVLGFVFQAIGFSDRLVVQLVGEGVHIEVAGPDLGPVEKNLAYRAAVAFRDAAALEVGVHVSLTKRIPTGAGLGGGSSDAGAVLTALQHLTEDPLERADVMRIASELGADVPFFVCGSALAVGSGKGDLLEPVEPLREVDMLVVLPPVHVATGAAFARLGRSDVSSRSSEYSCKSGNTAPGCSAPSGCWRAFAGCAARASTSSATARSAGASGR